MRVPNLSFADLEQHLARGTVCDLRYAHGAPRLLTDTHVGNRVGVARETVFYWRRRGLKLHTAERIADRLGEHPIAIWPGYLDAVLGACV